MADVPKSQLLIWAVAAVVLVAAGTRLLDRGGGSTAGPAPRVAVVGPGERAGARADGGGLYVHVAGAVRRPGLYRVPRGSRVAAAVARAGGPSRRGDLTTVNLAASVQDGQQVIVPRRGASAPAGPGGSPAPAPPGAPGAPAAGPISLSSATPEQLDGLDGIGPTLAQRIVAYRDAHGGFKSVDELRQVEGIGDKRFESLRQALSP
jgi:competence protein ComEA